MSGNINKSGLLWLFAVALLALFASGELLAIKVWTGMGAQGDWNDPANWIETVPQNPPGVPGPNDDVNIQTASIANKPILPVSPVATCNNLTLGNGEIIGGSGTLFFRGNFFINNIATFTAQDATLVAGGVAAQNITSANQRIGNLTIQNTSAVGVTFGGQWVIGDPNARTTITVNANARLTFTANVNLSNTTVNNSGLIRLAAAGNQSISGGTLLNGDTVNVGNVDMIVNNAGGTGTINGPINFRNLTMDGAGSGSLTGSVGISGNFTDTLAGTCTMPNAANSILTLLGQTGAPARTFTLNPAGASPRFSCFRMIVAERANVTMSGTFILRAKGTLNPALLVEGASSTVPNSVAGRLVLAPGTTFDLSDVGGESLVRVAGRFETTAGPGATRPRFIGGFAPEDRARFSLAQTGFLNVDGLVLDGFGNNASAYAMVLGDGSTVELFDNVSILRSSAVTSVIDLNTGNNPPKESWDALELEAAPGGSPRNIDAGSIGGFVLHLTAGPTSGNNLYGIAFELDPNNVLSWDSAPALTITTSSPLNPPATAGAPFRFTLQGAGGNAPYVWTAANSPTPPLVGVTELVAPNPPAPVPVLYLDPLTGRVSTDPLYRITNPTGFPGDPGYDPGQEPVTMPLANAGGLYSINFTAEDRSKPAKTATKAITFAVNQAPRPVPQINTFALPDAFEGADYPSGVAISAVNSTPTIPYPNNNPGFVYDISPNSPDQLPPNLTLDANTGAITGVPTFGAAQGLPSALYTIEFRVADIHNNTAVQQIDLRVFKGVPPLQLGSAAPPNAKEGEEYNFQLNALGGITPYSWDLGPGSSELPLGLYLLGNGQVGGTPEDGAMGDYSIVWRVTDASGQQKTQSVILRVNPPDPPELVFDTGGSAGCSSATGSRAPWLLLLMLGSLAGIAAILRRRTA